MLDIGCGFGETALEIAQMVGPSGEVVGIDCTDSFLDIANQERDAAGANNVRYEVGDAQVCDLPESYFDVAYSRFGVMFFQSAVRALRNANRALKPGGKVCLIVWRSLADNPCWGAAKEVALRHLPPPGDGASTCGPGPFSMAGEDTDRAMLEAAGFPEVEVFRESTPTSASGETSKRRSTTSSSSGLRARSSERPARRASASSRTSAATSPN